MSKEKLVGFVGKGKLGSLLLERPGFVYIDCDIRDISSIQKSKMDVDVVVNLAAISNVAECEYISPKTLIDTNVRGVMNLHQVYGDRVLTVSSDQVFSGDSLFLPHEYSKRAPVNKYGLSKLAAEEMALDAEGKVIRLSRTVSMQDKDIENYVDLLMRGEHIKVPSFFYRNYMTRAQAVEGIIYFLQNYDDMPKIVNFGGRDNISMYALMVRIAKGLRVSPSYVEMNTKYREDTMAPRPKRGGFRISLAEKLGFPIPKIDTVVDFLLEEYYSGDAK